uniref:GOLD domain-containing protein n=1 Tax=Aureoumbra lagunensis TaxID=44058 RepID=A0A6S8DQP2_9STRA|mmetsp:Transcript_14282/g.17759  ORF Transcript_14282/g.17759 Transcript_14282/m.17759 type:complete len:183 (-) Transcript_14282:462-1010(-)
MVNERLVVIFGVLASGTALSHQEVIRIPKAVAKGLGAGVLTFSLWNVQPSNGAMLEDAMILSKAMDIVIKDKNPSEVESPYPQPTPQENKRLMEIDSEQQQKMNDLVRNKDLDKAKAEINTEIKALGTEIKALDIKKIDAKIDDVKTELKSKIDTNSFVLGALTLVNSVVVNFVVLYFKKEE